jgi:hypothetical protein
VIPHAICGSNIPRVTLPHFFWRFEGAGSVSAMGKYVLFGCDATSKVLQFPPSAGLQPWTEIDLGTGFDIDTCTTTANLVHAAGSVTDRCLQARTLRHSVPSGLCCRSPSDLPLSGDREGPSFSQQLADWASPTALLKEDTPTPY